MTQEQQKQPVPPASATAIIDVTGCDWHIERGVPGARVTGIHESLLQECEKDIIWYRDNFIGKRRTKQERSSLPSMHLPPSPMSLRPTIVMSHGHCLRTAHSNLLAATSSHGPLAVSVIREDDHYKVLIRSTDGSERLVIQTTAVPASFLRRLFAIEPPVKSVVRAASNVAPVDAMRVVRDVNVPNALLAIEERQVIRSYKFGVMYLGAGQSTEMESFNNNWEHTSPAFTQFLEFLGERIELNGWTGYRAGLDVSQDLTGTHSYYTKWQSHEIMFHVATCLPFTPREKQQLERKRHLGNDIVILIFTESERPFDLCTLKNQQNHLVIMVRPQGQGYELVCVARDGVPVFKPELPEPAYIERNAVSRDFLLYKLVNGERACYRAPSFASKIARTRAIFLGDVAERFVGKAEKK